MDVLILFVIAVVVVLATSVFKHVEWSSQVKNLVATVLSVAGAAVWVWLSGEFDVSSLPAGILQVYGLSQLIYQFILKGTGLDARLEAIGQ